VLFLERAKFLALLLADYDVDGGYDIKSKKKKKIS